MSVRSITTDADTHLLIFYIGWIGWANFLTKEMARRRVAQLSGAALGAIHGTIPGAIIGWHAGGRLDDYFNAKDKGDKHWNKRRKVTEKEMKYGGRRKSIKPRRKIKGRTFRRKRSTRGGRRSFGGAKGKGVTIRTVQTFKGKGRPNVKKKTFCEGVEEIQSKG